MKNAEVIPGAHSLSTMFEIDNPATLQEAMETTFYHGGRLFEIPYLLCKLPWRNVGRIAKEVGIEEISLCHFWPRSEEDGAPYGDPLGIPAEQRQALATMEKIIAAAKTLRKAGVVVRFIDGPLWGCLGWSYTEQQEDLEDHMVGFLRAASSMCAREDLILAVEFLRSEEGCVVQGTRHMMAILDRINANLEGDEILAKMHFDVFHALERGEDPATSIRKARKHIAYLHLHGDKRIAPGAEGDHQNWKKIVAAVKTICFFGTIPVVSEPFGEETRRENPALGQGLPPTPPLSQYLAQAFGTLRDAGLRI